MCYIQAASCPREIPFDSECRHSSRWPRTRLLRAVRGGRRLGWGQVVPRRGHRLQDAACGGVLDAAGPVRAARGDVLVARVAALRAADQPARRPARHPHPYRVVAEPEIEHFHDEDDPERAWRREKALAAATRRRLVLDVLSGLLPYEVSKMVQTRIVLLRAVRAVGGRPDAHPGRCSRRCAATPPSTTSTPSWSPTSSMRCASG